MYQRNVFRLVYSLPGGPQYVLVVDVALCSNFYGYDIEKICFIS